MRLMSIREGSAELLADLPAALRPDELLWVDCHYDEARAWVAPVSRLCGVSVFENHLLDAENRAHPSYFESTQGYEMMVFRGLAVGTPHADDPMPIRIRTRPMVFYLMPRCLVTVRAPDSRIVPNLQERLLDSGRAQQRRPSGPEELLLRLLNALVDRYLELRQPLTEQIERAQRMLLDPRRPFRDWFALLEARGELRKLEQLCEEQLDALQDWRDSRDERTASTQAVATAPLSEAPRSTEPGAIGPLSDAAAVRANDVASHIQRVLNHARRLQESAETGVQLHFASTAHRTNEVMRMLTAITAIFLPLTLITGIFGMNFEFIPGLHARNAFWVAIGVMALIALTLLVYFRARRLLAEPQANRSRRRGKPEHTADARGTAGGEPQAAQVENQRR